MPAPCRFVQIFHIQNRGSLSLKSDVCYLCYLFIIIFFSSLQCKRLVLKYTPLILVKGQKFLETTDVCSAIHACKAGTQASMEAMPLSATL
jgi:hypothetical protein